MRGALKRFVVFAVSFALIGLLNVVAQAGVDGSRKDGKLSSMWLSDREALGLVFLMKNNIGVKEKSAIVISLSPGVSFSKLEPAFFHSGDLEGVREESFIDGDRDRVRRYRIMARRYGDYEIVVQVSVDDRTGKKPIRKLLTGSVNLMVTRKRASTLAGNFGVVIGAVLGVLSSFIGLVLKSVMDDQARKREETRWLTNELVGRLEAARVEVKSQRSVNHDAWMDELYSRHFSALRRWNSSGSGSGIRLSHELIQIEGLFRKYNRSLSEVAVDRKLIRELDQRIGFVVEHLSS